jgi:hypothetical protein
MSELTTIRAKTNHFRWHLLATASIVALMALGASQRAAEAGDTFLSDSDHPSFWIELGGDFQHIDGQTERWAPPGRVSFAGNGLDIRKNPSGSFGIEGKASYQLKDSPWIVIAGARYGRAQRQDSFHTQRYTAFPSHRHYVSNYNATTRQTENHMVVDFQVGRDFGLGLQEKHGHVIIGAGVRIAQFNLDSTDFASSHPSSTSIGGFAAKIYGETRKFKRRTSAMGPTISLSATTPLISNDGGGLMFDWGVNGAILFGRQKVMSQDMTHYQYHRGQGLPEIDVSGSSSDFRAKSVIIPNVGAFAGISYHLPVAKLAIGYRADLYFDGIDGGVDARNRINRSFYGPFATVSIGFGD